MLRRAGFDAVEMGPTGHRALAFVRGQKPIVGSRVVALLPDFPVHSVPTETGGRPEDANTGCHSSA